MKLVRLITGEDYKGEKHYLRNQMKYELAKTIILFAISGAFLIARFFTTELTAKVLTVIAILGCLPACKCLVELIMFIRFKTLDNALSDKFEEASVNYVSAFDRVFTSADKTFVINHIVIRSGAIIGYSNSAKLKEADFQKHIEKYLKSEGIKDYTIKIFFDDKKYLERLKDLNDAVSTNKDQEALKLLLSISL